MILRPVYPTTVYCEVVLIVTGMVVAAERVSAVEEGEHAEPVAVVVHVIVMGAEKPPKAVSVRVGMGLSAYPAIT